MLTFYSNIVGRLSGRNLTFIVPSPNQRQIRVWYLVGFAIALSDLQIVYRSVKKYRKKTEN